MDQKTRPVAIIGAICFALMLWIYTKDAIYTFSSMIENTNPISDYDFHRYLMAEDAVCNYSWRAGAAGDGGWDICLSEPFNIKAPCIVYDFGINNEWTFDDAVESRFGCHIKAYDPSMNASNHRRGKMIDFWLEGIAGQDHVQDNGWIMFTFETILKMQGDTKKIIDYLKIDVEWSEWQVLPNMNATGAFENVKQIGIEIHRKQSDTNALYLIQILEYNGFRKWKMHYNMNCGYKLADLTDTSCCLEMYFINTKYLDEKTKLLFLPHDYPKIIPNDTSKTF